MKDILMGSFRILKPTSSGLIVGGISLLALEYVNSQFKNNQVNY